MDEKVIPFLKWAGGKRWFADGHLEKFLPKKFNRYIEPFLGSGAVFFNVLPQKAILNDLNSELILTYQSIKKDWARVSTHLKKHSLNHSEDYYYRVRDRKCRDQFSSAARFIYLNRTCFNGLYRVNLRGQFNVPKGSKDSVILPTDNFELISKQLKNARLLNMDFERVVDLAQKDDFLFVDPPYTVKHNNNGFIKYNETIFSWNDQVRLSDALTRAKKRGAYVVCTNANHSSIKSLFKNEFNLKALERASLLAASKEKRGKFDELIIYHR